MQLLLPIIEHDGKEVAVAATGLGAFIKAIEDRVVNALQRVLTALMDTVRPACILIHTTMHIATHKFDRCLTSVLTAC